MRAVYIGGALVALAFVLSFIRVADYPFVWDDVAVHDSPAYRVSLWEGLTATQHDHLGVDLARTRFKAAHDSYRPLMYLSYRSDVSLFGMEPGPMHVHNVVLGLLVAALAGWTAARWCLPPAWAVLVSAIMALHPMQVEAIAYVSGRGDLLAAGFALSSVLACLAAFDRTAGSRAARGYTALAALTFLASLFSKEAYLGLPLVVACIAWSRGNTGRRMLGPVLTLLGVLGAYLIVRLAAAGASTGVSPVAGLVALPGIVLDYLHMAWLPLGLNSDRLYDAAWTAPGWAAAACVGAAGLWSLRAPAPPSAGQRLVRRLVAAYAWVLVLVGPSALVVLLHGVSADRYMHLPMFGFAVGVACAFEQGWRARPALRPALAVVGTLWLALWLLLTQLQIPVWRSALALYTNAVTHSPDSSMAHYRLGYAYARRGRCDLAVPRFERALALDEGNVRSRNNLGVCLMRAGRHQPAAELFERVVEDDPSHFRAYFNLGKARHGQGDRRGACEAFARAVWLNPQYTPAREAMAAHCDDTASSVVR